MNKLSQIDEEMRASLTDAGSGAGSTLVAGSQRDGLGITCDSVRLI